MVAHTNRLNDHFREAITHPTEMVKDHPLPSMLLMFGLGMGVGVVVAQALCSSLIEEESPTMTEKMRKQVFDAISGVLPPSMMRQLQSYTS
jgi:hypothetical protein